MKNIVIGWGGGGYEKDSNRGVCMKKLVIGLFV